MTDQPTEPTDTCPEPGYAAAHPPYTARDILLFRTRDELDTHVEGLPADAAAQTVLLSERTPGRVRRMAGFAPNDADLKALFQAFWQARRDRRANLERMDRRERSNLAAYDDYQWEPGRSLPLVPEMAGVYMQRAPESDIKAIAALDLAELPRLHHTVGQRIRTVFALWLYPWEEIIGDQGADHSPYHPDAISMRVIENIKNRLLNQAQAAKEESVCSNESSDPVNDLKAKAAGETPEAAPLGEWGVVCLRGVAPECAVDFVGTVEEAINYHCEVRNRAKHGSDCYAAQHLGPALWVVRHYHTGERPPSRELEDAIMDAAAIHKTDAVRAVPTGESPMSRLTDRVEDLEAWRETMRDTLPDGSPLGTLPNGEPEGPPDPLPGRVTMRVNALETDVKDLRERINSNRKAQIETQRAHGNRLARLDSSDDPGIPPWDQRVDERLDVLDSRTGMLARDLEDLGNLRASHAEAVARRMDTLFSALPLASVGIALAAVLSVLATRRR